MVTADTTQGLMEKFNVALAPGMASNMTVDQVEKLTVSLSTAMSALSIPRQQTISEIHELLSGENLRSSQIAQSLGLGEKEIKQAIQKGDLYKLLSERLKDLTAAGEVQSRTLTGVSSSLQDVLEKLTVLVGAPSVEHITEAFSKLLDSIVNADGSLTPFGENLTHLATDTGLVVDGMTQAFLGLLPTIEKVSGAIGGAVHNAALIAQALAGRNRLTSIGLRYNGEDMTVGDLEKRLKTAQDEQASLSSGSLLGDFNTPEYHRRRNDLAIEIGRMKGTLQPYYTALANDLREKTTPDDGTASGDFGTTITPIKHNIPTKQKSQKGAQNFEDENAIRKVMADYAEALKQNQIFEGGFTGAIAAAQKYLPLIKELTARQKEAQALKDKEIKHIQSDELNARLELGKVQKKQAEDNAEFLAQLEIKETEVLNKLKALDDAETLNNIKDSTKKLGDELKDSFSKGTISAQEYYTKVKELQEGLITARYNAAKEQNQRDLDVNLMAVSALMEDPRSMNRTKTDLTPEARQKLWELKDKNTSIQSQGRELERGYTREISNLATDTETQIANHTESGFKKGLQTAIGFLESGDFMGFDKFILNSAKDGLITAFTDSAVGKALGKSVDSAFAAIASNPMALGALATAGVGIFIAQQGTKQAQEQQNVNFDLGIAAAKGSDPVLAAQLDVEKQYRDEYNRVADSNTPWWQPVQNARDANGLSTGMITEQQQKQLKAFKENLEKQSALQRETAVSLEEEEQKRYEEREDKRRKRGLVTAEEDLQRIQKILKDFQGSQAMKDYLEDKSWELEQEIAQKRQVLFDAQTSYRDRMMQEQIEAAKRTTDILIGEAQREFNETKKLMDAKYAAEQNLATLGLKSRTAVDLAQKQDTLNANKDEINRLATLNGSYSQEQSKILNTLSDLVAINSTNNAVDLGNGEAIKSGGLQNFSLDNNTLGQRADTLIKFLQSGGQIFSQATGQYLNAQSLAELNNRNNTINDVFNTNSQKADQLEQENIALRRDLDAQSANSQFQDTQQQTDQSREIEALKLAATDFGPEGTNSRAYKAAEKILRLKQIDDQINDREKQAYQNGLASSPTDTSSPVIAQLEQIRQLMKAEVNKPDYSDQNPLPVRVVEMPKLYASPTSRYFQAAAQPILNLHPGAVQISGTGLSPEQLEAVTTKAIANAAGAVARVINIENDSQNSRLANS